MSGSYKKINYSLRPAKSVERKMILETARRLLPFGTLEKYRYVGFGSPYFVDFTMFHNQLGIEKMVSIEADEEARERFEHNKPFRCISMLYGKSTAVLPTLEWEPRTIYWFDYDGRLDGSILQDVETLAARAAVGSLIIFALNVDPKEEGRKTKLEDLQNKVGKREIPMEITELDLSGWGTAKVCRSIINNKILETLVSRNTGYNKVLYRQLFNFHYQDNAMMLCVGGILYDEGQTAILNACEFDKLDFIRTDEDVFSITIPKLTRAELRFLNTQLPGLIDDQVSCRGIPMNHIKNYCKLYRYFPNFSEIDL